MPKAPLLPPQMLQQAIDPQNFLLAAADLHQGGELQSDVPAGKSLQTGKVSRSKRMKVVK